jgi:hypothetical protein
VTRSLELVGPGEPVGACLRVHLFLYFSTPLVIVITNGVFATYGIIALVWMAQGERADDLESIFDESPGWPPFILPGWIFSALTVAIVATAIMLLFGPKGGPIRSQSLLLPFVWGLSSVCMATYAVAFDYAEGWPTYVIYFAAVMAVCSIVGFGAAAVRGLRKRAVRRREEAAEA